MAHQSIWQTCRSDFLTRLGLATRIDNTLSYEIETLEQRQLLSGSPVTLSDVTVNEGQLASSTFQLDQVRGAVFQTDFSGAIEAETTGYLAVAPSDDQQSFLLAREGQLQIQFDAGVANFSNDDPTAGAVITAFSGFDPQDPDDSFDILTGWNAAIDELATLGTQEVTFAVYRQVRNGNLQGGPEIETVRSAISYANQHDLSVTVLPLFEVFTSGDGWRGEYDPTGAERTRFRTQYTQFVTDLASIEGIDRFNIGTELNEMVNNTSNADFFEDLIESTKTTLAEAGNTETLIGYAANFDAFDNDQHAALWNHPDIDFLGVSAYFSIVDPTNAALVSDTGAVSDSVLDHMVDRWTTELDRLEATAAAHDLPILIQEFGAVQENYASVYPFAVSPGNFLPDGTPNAYELDPGEQKAAYESLLIALDGRGDVFESVFFWSWEHGADRGERTYEDIDPNETRYINRFAIWPGDNGGGDAYTEFLATQNSLPETVAFEIEFELYTTGGWGDTVGESLTVLVNGQPVLVDVFSTAKSATVNTLGYARGDAIHHISLSVQDLEGEAELSVQGTGTTSSKSFGIDNLVVTNSHEPINISASVGTLTQDENGEFTWTLAAEDGPAESQTIEISGLVMNTPTELASFELIVNNLAPAISVSNSNPVFSSDQTATLEFSIRDVDALTDVSVKDSNQQPIGLVTLLGTHAHGESSYRWSHDGATPGTHTLTISATDKDGATATTNFDLNVFNLASTIKLESNTIEVEQGDDVTLVFVLADAESDSIRSVTVRNASGDTIGQVEYLDSEPSGLGSYQWKLNEVNQPGSQTLSVTIQDEFGVSVTEDFSLNVNNLAPVVQPIIGPVQMLRETNQTFSAIATDAGGDPLTTTWNVFRGDELVASSNESSFDFLSAENGSFRIVFTASDGSASSSVETLVSVQSAFINENGDLLIQGTENRDRIHIGPARIRDAEGSVRVVVNKDRLVFVPTGKVIVYGGDGNDLIRVSGSARLDIDTELHGGDGNDIIAGGRGNDILRGGNGNDRLTGSFGDDHLFGDAGMDRLTGSSGNDRLDGGNDEEEDRLVGSAGADLYVNHANDRLIGFNVDDELLDLLV